MTIDYVIPTIAVLFGFIAGLATRADLERWCQRRRTKKTVKQIKQRAHEKVIT